jgi:hypothetical protein
MGIFISLSLLDAIVLMMYSALESKMFVYNLINSHVIPYKHQKIKHVADGSIEKFIVRFVARGLFQKEGVDYEETFSLVTRYASIRAIISIV